MINARRASTCIDRLSIEHVYLEMALYVMWSCQDVLIGAAGSAGSGTRLHTPLRSPSWQTQMIYARGSRTSVLITTVSHRPQTWFTRDQDQPSRQKLNCS